MFWKVFDFQVYMENRSIAAEYTDRETFYGVELDFYP